MSEQVWEERSQQGQPGHTACGMVQLGLSGHTEEATAARGTGGGRWRWQGGDRRGQIWL